MSVLGTFEAKQLINHFAQGTPRPGKILEVIAQVDLNHVCAISLRTYGRCLFCIDSSLTLTGPLLGPKVSETD